MWTKLPPVISLNPDLTKDLNGRRTHIKVECIWKYNKAETRMWWQWHFPMLNCTIKTKSVFRRRTTYSETTSDGKVWGTDRTFSHRALSLVQVHPPGHLGCLTLRPSARSKLTAASQTRSVHPLHPLSVLPGYPIPSVPVGCSITPAHATSRKILREL